MATHSSVLAWRIPGMGKPGGLPSMGSHRVGHDWSDLAAAAAVDYWSNLLTYCVAVFSFEVVVTSSSFCWLCSGDKYLLSVLLEIPRISETFSLCIPVLHLYLCLWQNTKACMPSLDLVKPVLILTSLPFAFPKAILNVQLCGFLQPLRVGPAFYRCSLAICKGSVLLLLGTQTSHRMRVCGSKAPRVLGILIDKLGEVQ